MPGPSHRRTALRVSTAGRVRARAGPLLRSAGLGRRWVRRLPERPDPEPLEDFALYAVLTSYMEADIIGATTRNALRQGCDRVLLIDNDSPDATVATAAAAGAEVAGRYATDRFDLRHSLDLVGRLMAEESAASPHRHVWWLLLDADEFPHGPAGRTVRQHLATVDRRCTVVGARVFAHFPGPSPTSVPDRHPLDYQPLCEEVRVAKCPQGHWKHPLVRWGRGEPPVRPGPGHHQASGPSGLWEPALPVFLHHFQYRERQVTSERLRRLCAPGPDGHYRNELNDTRQGRPSGITERWRSLDAVYEGRWAEVPRVTARGHAPGVRPRPWPDQVAAVDVPVARWYGPGEGAGRPGADGR